MHDDPQLPRQQNLRQTGYNSACIGVKILTSNMVFSQSLVNFLKRLLLKTLVSYNRKIGVKDHSRLAVM